MVTGLINFPGSNGSNSAYSMGAPAAASWDFTVPSMPPQFTFTRASTATYRDSTGTMQIASSNQPRFNHSQTGTPLGLRIENARTNLFTNYSANPTATTGFTTTGTVVLNLDVDAAALAAVGLGTVCPGNVYQVFGGVSGGTLTLPGTTGSTSNCSFSMWARLVSGTASAFSNTSASATSVNITSAVYTRILLPNQTISATTVQPIITLPANSVVYFILPQTEVGPHCSSEIITTGAAATRVAEVMVDTSITTRSYYNSAEGSIFAEFTFDDILTNPLDSMLLLAAGTGLTYALGVARVLGTTRSKALFRGYINSVNGFIGDVIGLDAAFERYPAAIAWNNGTTLTATAGADCFTTISPTGPFIGIDRLYIGCRAFTESTFGHVLSLKIYNYYRTPAQLGLDMVHGGDKVIFSSGQSNMVDWFSAQTGANNTGQRTAQIDFDAALPGTSRNFLMNGGSNGTSVIYYPATSTSINWWYDPATGSLGVPFQRWISMAQGCRNGSVIAQFDTSGESDAGLCTQTAFYNAMLAKFTIMQGYTGVIPMGIIPIGFNGVTANNGYQDIWAAQVQLAANNPSYIFLTPERFDLPVDATLFHMTDAAAGTMAHRAMRKLLKFMGFPIVGGVDGPTISNVSRSGSTVTVTIAHDTGGTDFTPTTAISGFQYFNGADYNATANAITSAVRTNATTITLTLTTASAGTLYYALGTLNTQVQANLVRDNSTQVLPLRRAVFTVA